MKKFSFPTEAYSSLTSFLVLLIISAVFLRCQDFDSMSTTAALFFAICSPVTFIVAVTMQKYFSWKSSATRISSKHSSTFAVSWRAALLGCVFSFGLFLANNEKRPNLSPFGFYLCILSFFHWSEYFATAVSSWDTLTLDSFLLNHSVEYWVAAISSWLEFGVECYFFPSMKSLPLLTWMGVVMCIVGEVFRKLAMFTAGRSFTHLIQYKKRTDHQLVTHGIYSLFRHPSYVGWFWWSIGTQVTLCNPICAVIYAVISWRFFDDRIYHEEITLINFFGEDYVDYQRRVPTGLPGIVGYTPLD